MFREKESEKWTTVLNDLEIHKFDNIGTLYKKKDDLAGHVTGVIAVKCNRGSI